MIIVNEREVFTMVDKLVDRLTEIIQVFCDRMGFDVVIDNDKEFYCYPNDREVFYSLTTNKRQSKWFMENAFAMGLAYDCGDFCLSLLHEVGHCETEQTLTKGQKISRTKRKKNLNGIYKKDNFIYFGLVDEVKATEWAIQFANTHKKELAELSAEIQKVLI